MLHWSVGGYFWRCGGLVPSSVWDTAPKRSSVENARERWDRPRAGLNWQEVWLTHTRAHTHTHTLNRCTYIHKQTDRHTPSFQLAPHLGDSYFRKEHSIRTHIASSSPPFLLPLPSLLPPSLWPSSSPPPLSSLFSASTLYISSVPACFQSR